MNNPLVSVLEILLTIVGPLVFLYLCGWWSLKSTILCLLSIPTFLWYLTYSPLHELSHVLGTDLVGGGVTQVELIPRFWRGEFARAWITSYEITNSWQQFVSTGFPYFLDVVSVATGLWLLRRGFSRNAFLVGLVFMLLCLRPLFDLVCETVAFLSGDRGDIYFFHQILGGFWTWLFLILSIGLSLVSVPIIVRRFAESPKSLS